MDDRPSSNDNQNVGTMLALVGLILIALFLFGLVTLILPLPGVVFWFVVLAFLFFIGAFQYIILRWWFSRRRFEEHEDDDSD